MDSCALSLVFALGCLFSSFWNLLFSFLIWMSSGWIVCVCACMGVCVCDFWTIKRETNLPLTDLFLRAQTSLTRSIRAHAQKSIPAINQPSQAAVFILFTYPQIWTEDGRTHCWVSGCKVWIQLLSWLGLNFLRFVKICASYQVKQKI